MDSLTDPKYFVGDQVIYCYIDSGGGGYNVCIIDSISGRMNKLGILEWNYCGSGCYFSENQIIKKLK